MSKFECGKKKIALFCSLFESSQSLFWASFGMVGLETFELEGIKSYTRFWGLLMFGSYSVINVIVLLNLLIAMMSNSYAMITVSDFNLVYHSAHTCMQFLSSFQFDTIYLRYSFTGTFRYRMEIRPNKTMDELL